MGPVSRRSFMLGGLSTLGALAVTRPASGAPSGEPAGDPEVVEAMRTYVGLAAALSIPLVTRDPVAWEARGDDTVSPSDNARANYAFRTLTDARRELDLRTNDVYGSTRRLNAALRSRPELQKLAGFGLAAVVDPNAYVDTAELATGRFPESEGDDLPRLARYPMG